MIGVGSIKHPDDALEALEKDIPLVAVGRELVVEPNWVQKIQNGEVESIRQSMSRNDQEELSISGAMWDYISPVPGWFPIEENEKQSDNEPWLTGKK